VPSDVTTTLALQWPGAVAGFSGAKSRQKTTYLQKTTNSRQIYSYLEFILLIYLKKSTRFIQLLWIFS
jgi:hypothetical protein